MHILIGALVGGALFTISYAVMSKIKGDPLSWHGAAAAFAGGIVTGGLAATTLGASLLAEGGATAVATVAVEGAAGSGVQQATENALDKKPIMQDVVTQAAWGAATAPLFYGAFKGMAKFLPDAEALAKNPVTANMSKVLADGESLVKTAIGDATKAAGKNAVADAAQAAKDIESGAADAAKVAPVDGAPAPVADAKPVVADAAKPADAPAAKTSLGDKARTALSNPVLKDSTHHARAASGLAASGAVLTAIDKVKSMFGGSSTSDSSSTNPSTAAKTTPATPSTPDSGSGDAATTTTTTSTPSGNVTVSIPTNSNVKVTIEVENGTTTTSNTVAAPAQPTIPGPAVHAGVGSTDDGAVARREGITDALGHLGGN